MSGIQCESLSFSYGDHEALQELDLSVPYGEIYGLLGPNGAGKTTTIKILVGLLKPKSGSAQIGGYSITDKPVDAKQISGYMPDKPHLYERLTAWEYLEFVAGLWNLESGSWEDSAKFELERWSLDEVTHNLVESFSQGMRQKLLLIAGLIHKPKIWVLDEPMSGLDPKSCRMLRDVLLEEAKRGAAILLSTHTLDMAERMCDRIGIIDRGVKIAEGTLEELQSKSETNGQRLEELFLKLTEE